MAFSSGLFYDVDADSAFQNPEGGCRCDPVGNSSVIHCLLGFVAQHSLANASTWWGDAAVLQELELCSAEESKLPAGMFESFTVDGHWEPRWLGTTGAGAIFGYIGLSLAVLSLLNLLCRSLPQLRHFLETCRQEELSPAIQGKLLDVKADQMRVLVQTSCYLLIPITAWSPWWDIRPAVFSRATAVALAQNVLAVLALFPRTVTPKSIDAVYSLLALLLVFVSSPLVVGGDAMSLLLLSDGLMLALTAVRRTTFTRLPLLPAVNLLFLASTCAVIAQATTVFGEFRAYFVVAQGLLVLLMSLSAPLLERKSRRLLCRVMEVEELQELVSACRCLLRSCFDVVVELDADGRMASCPELGALLLRDRQCLEGMLFSDLIEDEESRQAFEQRLAGPARKELGLAESLQVSMRDACSNCLQLEVMWLGFCKMGERGSERRFMLGLREFADFRREQAPRPEEDAPTVWVQLHANAQRLRRQPWWARQPAVSVASESQSVPETHSVSSGSCLDTGAVLVVDSSKAGYPVHRVSRAFRAQVGHVRRGKELTRLLCRPKLFENWLVKEMELRHHDGTSQGDCQLVFKMPQGHVSALARLLLPDSSSEEEKGEDSSVSLLIHAIRTEGAATERAQKMANRGTRPASDTVGRLEQLPKALGWESL